MKPALWTPEQGYPDGARARDFLRQERDRWKHIRDPRVEEQYQYKLAYSLISHRGDVLGVNGGTGGALNTVGADIIFVVEQFNAATSGTLSDSLGNTWVQGTKRDSTGSECGSCLWHAKNAIVGAAQTFAIAGLSTFCSIQVAAFSGSDLTAPFDNEVGASVTTSTTTPLPTITPGGPSQLIIYWVSLSQAAPSCSIDLGITMLDETSSGAVYVGAMGYEVASSARTATWTHSSYKTSGGAATFIAASGGPPPPPPYVDRPRGAQRPFPFLPGSPQRRI